MSRTYRSNRHDSTIFSYILADLVLALKEMCGDESDLVLVLDKGNNSQENSKGMTGVISWVGTLVPSYHQDLMESDLSAY